ncbi:hypothetical protein L195_g058184, partial [Trifolium pratense]
DLASELMRIAAEQKGEKSKKKARRSKPHTLIAEQTASGSISQSSPVGSSAGTPGGADEDHRRLVPVSERDYVLGVSAAARQNQLTQDIAAVIRLAETALVLNEGGPTREMEKLAAQNARLEGSIVQMEGELIDLRGKQENYGQLLEDVRVTREELEKTKKELEEVKTQGAEEKKKLEE